MKRLHKPGVSMQNFIDQNGQIRIAAFSYTDICCWKLFSTTSIQFKSTSSNKVSRRILEILNSDRHHNITALFEPTKSGFEGCTARALLETSSLPTLSDVKNYSPVSMKKL